jgi:D-alanine-D-alanine ligase
MPDAADVLEEAAYIATGLKALGHETLVVPVGLDLASLVGSIGDLRPDVVFNLMESIGGYGRLISVVPALLESLRIPFTGCSASAQWTTSNKLEAKLRMAAAGVATPQWITQKEVCAADADSSAGLWIVKSVWEHASLGLDDESVVEFNEVRNLIERRAAQFGGDWFAERFIAGRELNVALIGTAAGPRVLPVAEIRFEDYPPGKPQIVGYAAKWHAASPEYTQTVRSFAVEPSLAGVAATAALQCWETFALSGYARVDFRVDEAGRLWVLEINANPCLSPDAGFAAALEVAQVQFVSALDWILADAFNRAQAATAMAPHMKALTECFE